MRTTRGGSAAATALVAALALGAGALRAGGSTPADRQDAPSGRRESTAAAQETPTFRVGTRIATVDAVVVDDDGRHVTDLTPADFEVSERGARQTVRHAIYVQAARTPGELRDLGAPAPAAVDAGTVAPVPAPPAERTRALGAARGLPSKDHAGRVIAVVVDDLGLSFESTASVRQMLFRYVDRQIAPGDVVAILRTSGGIGALQQFTTDKRLLHAAVDRIRWSLNSRSGVGAFAPVMPPGAGSLFRDGDSVAGGTAAKDGDWSPLKENPDELKSQLTSVGSMGALEYVVRGIEPLDGRKSVVFVSEGFDLGIRERKSSRAWSAFTRVMDRANRAGVVVYALDPRGLQTAGLTAEDDPQTAKVSPYGGGPAPEHIRDAVTKPLAERGRALLDSQQSLVYLAEQTGGFAMLNTNDLSRALGMVIDDARGYYLIGFDTSLPRDQPWDPDDVRIRVTRPGLKVRARRGLFGPGDKDPTRDEDPADPLVAAALSPFAAGEIDVRLTTLFAHDPKAGSYVRSMFFIDPAGLTFAEAADGRREADLTILLMAIGDNGIPLSQQRVEVPLRLDADAYAQLRQRGLLYSATVPIRKPGGYQLRAAVRDERSSATGSSAQFVEVPKVGKNEVALSGVVLMDMATAGPAAGTSPMATRADRLADGVLGEPAIKIFRPGSEVAYTCEIYDGRGRREAGFSTSATLIRDGKAIYTTPPAPVGGAPREAKPVGTVPLGGRLTLGRRLPSGTYTLQVRVSPSGGRGRPATQWVDFEVR